MRFKVGDYVEYVGDNDEFEEAYHKIGRVIYISQSSSIFKEVLMVEYPESIYNGGSKAEKYGAKPGHGLAMESDDFILRNDDKPEESNMEEWLEESNFDKNGNKIFKYEVGDRVIGKDREVDGITLKHFKGKIIELDEDSDFYDYCVEFYDLMGKEFEWYVPEDSIELAEEPPEESNMEEWLEESSDFNYKLLRCVRNKSYEGLLTIGKIYHPIKIYYESDYNGLDDDEDGAYFVHLKFDDGEEGNVYLKRFEVVDDEPEESNMEEWLEESHNEISVGDVVEVDFNNSMSDPNLRNLLKKSNSDGIGIIVNVYNGGDRTFYFVRFNKSIMGLNTFIRNNLYFKHYSDNLMVYFRKYNYRNTWFFDKMFVEFVDDPTEDTNFEEWLEESNQEELKVGDRVEIYKITEDNPKDQKKYEERYLGKIGKIIRIKERVAFPYEVQIDGGFDINSFNSNELKLIDEIEDTNFEEWNEKKIQKMEILKDYNSYTNEGILDPVKNLFSKDRSTYELLRH